MFILKILPFTLFIISILFGAPTKLSIDEYLKQVIKDNDAYKSTDLFSQDAKVHKDEGSVITAPYFLFEYKKQSDSSYNPLSTVHPTRADAESYTYGIANKTPFGTDLKLSYNWMYYDIEGVSKLYLSTPQYYRGSPTLEIKQALWRNFIGIETRSMKDVIEAKYSAQNHEMSYRNKLILAQAESYYWLVSTSRRIKAMEEQALGYAKKISEWSEKRVSRGLADKSEHLQALAGVSFRELSLKIAINDLKKSERLFNQMRGIKKTEVPEILSNPTIDEKRILVNVKKVGVRGDVKAAEEEYNALEASSTVEKEKLKPSLDAFLSYSYTGLNVDKGEAQSQSFKDDKPIYAFGVTLTAPLDVFSRIKYNSAYNNDIIASKLKFERKKFEEQNDWQDLVETLKEQLEIYKLSIKMEDAQRKKLEFERKQLFRGKTTTFQVLSFEQEYVASELNLLKSEAQILASLSKIKTFGE